MATSNYDLVVIGAGPGGYACAFRAADLGLRVCLVEKYQALGGVCLNVGCIPSKALLHIAELIHQQEELAALGAKTHPPQLEIPKILHHKAQIIQKFNGGIAQMAKRRKVDVLQGTARFLDANTIEVEGEKNTSLSFNHLVIACGSEPVRLPFLPKDPRIFTSTGALNLPCTKGSLLIIGAGVIGCEMATIYQALGVEVTVVEMQDQIMPGADKDLVKPCQKSLEQKGVKFLFQHSVISVKTEKEHLSVIIQDAKGKEIPHAFNAILECVGRIPNSKHLALDKAQINTTDRGYITVNPKSLVTSNPKVFAIGDIIEGPGLAHKATAQGRQVAEIITGKSKAYDVIAIPSVAYTSPEVSWVGLTEQEAKAQNIPYKKGIFPWIANGRAACMDATSGFTKLIAAPDGRVLGAGIVGKGSGDLISEVTLAIEMGANIEDLALTVHPHPTLSESVGLSAEVIEGTITDL